MRLGFYYSQSQDWHEPNGAGNTWDFGADEKKDYDQYLRGKAEPQVRELLTGYGTGRADLVRHAAHDDRRSAAPLHEDRARSAAGHAHRRPARRRGRLREHRRQRHPAQRQGEAWEVPATINHTWGYRKDDTDWKSPGPDRLQARRHRQQGRQLPAERRADGRRRHPAGEPGHPANRRPLAAGERRRGYGAGPTPFGEELGEPSARGAKDVRGDPLIYQQIQWRVTTKPGKLFITFFDEPRAPFALPAIRNTDQARLPPRRQGAGGR